MWFHDQNQLLEVGWNKSEVTREDVEKTLNCCGFSSVNQSDSCPAVSQTSSSFLPSAGTRCVFSDSVLPPFSNASPTRSPAGAAHRSCRSTPARCCASWAASASSSASLRSVSRSVGQSADRCACRLDASSQGEARWTFKSSSCLFQILGVWLTHKYRNLKDPRSNPGAFL